MFSFRYSSIFSERRVKSILLWTLCCRPVSRAERRRRRWRCCRSAHSSRTRRRTEGLENRACTVKSCSTAASQSSASRSCALNDTDKNYKLNSEQVHYIWCSSLGFETVNKSVFTLDAFCMFTVDVFVHSFWYMHSFFWQMYHFFITSVEVVNRSLKCFYRRMKTLRDITLSFMCEMCVCWTNT